MTPGQIGMWAALAAVVAPSASRHTEVVIVGGLGGERAYEERFAGQVHDLAEATRRAVGDPARVHALSGGGATRDAVHEAFAAAARSTSASDVLIAIFVGHGNVDGTVYKLNLPGPDPTCDDLRAWLDQVPARHQLVVLATSASGACVQPLARDGRVVVSATRSGSERNAPVFGRYFVEALRDPAADTDHDEVVTALEAFRYAEQKVQRFYTDAQRLASEHPVLAGDAARDYVLARRGRAAAAPTGPASAALLARKAEIEARIAAVKERKAALLRDAYFNELEAVLLELARVQESLDLEAAP